MRKCSLLIFFIALSCSVWSQENALYQFTRNYYRSNPFETSFSAFLQHLLKDPGITNKTIKHRTDTSFFSFTGKYVEYNPFFYTPDRLEVLLYETVLQYSDSLPYHDTIFVYQLRAISDLNPETAKDVKREAEKIHRQYRRKFFQQNFKELDTSEELPGGVYNYFLPRYGLAPLSVAWGRLEESNEIVLSIIIRMKMRENMTVLPAPLYNPE